MRALIGCLVAFTVWADADVDQHWNDPGVTVREPNVWSNGGVMTSDTLGRTTPTDHQTCPVVRLCYPNGNCVVQEQCYH